MFYTIEHFNLTIEANFLTFFACEVLAVCRLSGLVDPESGSGYAPFSTSQDLPVGTGVAVSRNGGLVLRQMKSVFVAADDRRMSLGKKKHLQSNGHCSNRSQCHK